MSNIKIFMRGNVRMYISDLTSVAQKAIKQHQALNLSALTLATAVVVLGPLGILKNNGRVVSLIKSDGAVKNIIVEANKLGHIRALIGNSQVMTEYDGDVAKINHVPLQIAVGQIGSLKIVNEINRATFGGEVKLVKGDIVTDLAWYFDQSEQIKSAIISNVELKTTSQVKRAYSAIFQLLPNHNEHDVQWIESIVKNHKMKNFTSLDKWQAKLNDLKLLEQREVIWKCTCSRDKIRGVLQTLTPAEIEQIIKEEQKIEVTCNFCNKKYDFTKEFKK